MLWVSVIVSECAELAVGLMAGWKLSGILFCAPLQPAQEGVVPTMTGAPGCTIT